MYIVQMPEVTTKKATDIIKMFEEKTGDSFQIRKGILDARYKYGYYLFQHTMDGFVCPGTYGYVRAYAKTLKELALAP